ncbi:membrane protein [Thermovibrio guaymasensis]|uniref:Membrane protein n=1 Tax=Thermovibrio guaymasensis TaxID=240167 RepID=A0A420W6I4_9BACT|nr:YhjD/YihY/BrkB family envelope integrity protein [Thermovibrio guaymasensis]RKQ61637.1 membrane protein [Thermovibrio guaymasensis]
MICRRFLKRKSFINYFFFAVCDTFESDYQFFAASIAYYTLMSIIPLFIFLFFLGMVVFHVDFKNLIPKELFESPLKPIFLQIEKVLDKSGVISGTAALVMLWFSRGIFLSLERSFSEILKVENPAGFIYRHTVIILSIFLLWILMFLLYIAKYVLALLLPQFPELSFLSSLLVLLLLFITLVFVYYFLLPVSIEFPFILKISGVIFFILILVEKAFIWFVLNVSKVSILYGSFAALIIFLMWIYYSATVVLLGAGIVKGKLIAEGEIGNENNQLS